MKPQIAYIDDEAPNLTLVRKTLGGDFDVHCFDSGAPLFASDSLDPDLVLLDVQMPEPNGYAICQQLRERGYEKPVMFLSCFTAIDDRLRGYQAGGDDYLAKPFNLDELKFKINHNIEKYQLYKATQEKLGETHRFAFTAMTNASEMGQVIRFIQSTYDAQSMESLLVALKETLQGYGINAVFCARLNADSLFDSMDGRPVSSLEQQLLAATNTDSKIVTLGNRCLFLADALSILVKNMPADADKAGRLRDHLAIILDAANHHVHFLEAQLQRRANQAQLREMLRQKTQDLIENIDAVTSANRDNVNKTLEAIKLEMINLEFRLDLDEASLAAFQEMSANLSESFDTVLGSVEDVEAQVNLLIQAIQTGLDDRG